MELVVTSADVFEGGVLKVSAEGEVGGINFSQPIRMNDRGELLVESLPYNVGDVLEVTVVKKES